MTSKVKLPTILKHCVVAVIRDKKVSGTLKQKFDGAMDICRANLAKYGYLTSGSATGPVENIQLTMKGQVRERHHKFGERSATTEKTAAFDAMYEKFYGQAEKGAPTDKKPPAKVDTEPKPTSNTPPKIPKADDQI